MNRFGTQAQAWWQEHRPGEFSTMDDPVSFFSTLGDQIAARATELAPTLEGPDPAGEGYLEKVGRLNAARAQAQEIALDELVYSLGPELPPLEAEQDPLGKEIFDLRQEISQLG